MDLNVEKEVVALRQMTVPQLREKYRDVFGHETRSRHKAFLIKRIVWRLQALAEGDLTERARRRAEELANDADLRLSPPKPKAAGDEPAGRTATATLHLPGDSRLPMPGAVLTREYKDETVEVLVLPNGFQYAGEIYRSLSAVVRAITGTHWNGYHFFGLKKRGKDA